MSSASYIRTCILTQVLNVIVGDTFAIQLGLDALQPALLYARHVAAPRAHTQREMNRYFCMYTYACMHLCVFDCKIKCKLQVQ